MRALNKLSKIKAGKKVLSEMAFLLLKWAQTQNNQKSKDE
jgi:hypothetical protein